MGKNRKEEVKTRIKRRIKKGDKVFIITGKDKGKTGEVLELVKTGDYLRVDGINIAKKHVKPDPNTGVKGGVVDKIMPIHISNVMIYNPTSHKGDKVSYKTLEDGRKVRCYKSSGEVDRNLRVENI